MASKNISIINKKSSVPGKIPASADLELGELAINIHDGDVYIKKSDNSVIKVGDGGLVNWTETDGHILPNTNDTYDIGSSALKIRDLYMSGSTIHLGTQSISADDDGIKMPSIKIGTGGNEISLTASANGKLVQTAKVGGVTQSPVTYTIDGLDDTDISSLAAGNVLSYDVSSSKWVNSVPIDAYTKTEVDNLDAVITSNLATEVSDRTAADLLKADKSDTYTKTEVDTNISAIVDSAPETLNTLNELAAALGDDANHVTTITSLVGTKADQSTTYTKTEVDTEISNVSVDLSAYDTSAQVDTKLLTKSDTTHSHDGNYYLKGQVDTNITTAISNIPGSSSVEISETPPATPSDGDLWVDSTTMRMYIHYVDSDSAQWVEVVSGSGVQPVSGSGSGGGTYTAGVIWDNHDSTRTEYDESLSVVSGATLALTHDADTEELRSVYIEKMVEEVPESPGSDGTDMPTFISTSDMLTKTLADVTYVSGVTWAGRGNNGADGFNVNAFVSGDPIYLDLSSTSYVINCTINEPCVLYRIGDGDWWAVSPYYQLAGDVLFIKDGVELDLAVSVSGNYPSNGVWNLGSLPILETGDYTITHAVGHGFADNGWAFLPYTESIASVPASPAYWQLESFDDWGVQFTDSTTTTLINNTGADATIRARLTKPTALASTSGTTSGGLSVYLTPLDLPTTGSTGDQAYVESNTSLYIYDENITGWYRVALINQTPTFTSTPDASYSFAIDGTPIVVTPVAVDPEGSLVTYSVIGDTGTVATMTSVDNVYTFTPSTDESNEGSFSITFRATDGTNVADAISNFILEFVTFAVSLENPSNITNHSGYEQEGSYGLFTVVSDIKGALITNSPQYGSCTFVETINTTTFGDRFYIEMHGASTAYWGGIGIDKITDYHDEVTTNIWGTPTPLMKWDDEIPNVKISMLWDVPNGTIKFFHNGTPVPEHRAGNIISTVVPGEYYIFLMDGASAGTVIGAYIVTNPDYWTYDPEVLDQL
jgi:hypothetical protein